MALKVIHRRTAAPRTQLGLLAAVLLVSVCGFLHLETVSDVAFSLFINGSAVGTISMIGALLLMLLLTAGAYRSVTSSNKAAAYSKLLVVLQLGLWSVLVYVPATAIANGWLPAQIESVVCWRSMNEQPLSPLGMAHALVEQGHIERPARWLLALAYWQLQFGVLASCGIAAAIVLATSVGRRSLSGETTNPVAFLEAAGSWAHVASHTLCRSSVTVATISFLLYLLFVPVVSGTGSFGH